MDKGLSNFDINRLLKGTCKIESYSHLHKYKSLDELLYPNNCVIILFKSQPHYGHWVAVIKNKDGVEFFNSYGGYPDGTLDYISKDFRKKSNQDYPYLSDLLLKSKYPLFYNEFQFQKDGKDIKTCGRHAVLRVLLKDLDIYQYKNLLDYLCKKNNMNYDEIVTKITE